MSIYNIISNQVTIYAGTSLFVIGVLGNSINACVFYKNNLKNPSNFLLFLVSCLNIIYIHIGLLTRVLAHGFNIDITILDTSWCKIRYFLVQVCSLTSLSCVCYAMIDQFFISSQYGRLRRLSKISTTRKVTLIIIFVWILYTIPTIIFTDHIPLSNGQIVCNSLPDNLAFIRFTSYFNLPIVWAIGPVSVLIVFGILTYHNINLMRGNRNRERTQRHLTSMILLQVIFITIGAIPFAVLYTYLGITLFVIKSPDRQALENFLENIVAIISYFSYSCSFFVYYFASRTYRNQVKQLLHIFRRHRQVAPMVNPIFTGH
jgi:hypothetical protein